MMAQPCKWLERRRLPPVFFNYFASAALERCGVGAVIIIFCDI